MSSRTPSCAIGSLLIHEFYDPSPENNYTDHKNPPGNADDFFQSVFFPGLFVRGHYRGSTIATFPWAYFRLHSSHSPVSAGISKRSPCFLISNSSGVPSGP